MFHASYSAPTDYQKAKDPPQDGTPKASLPRKPRGPTAWYDHTYIILEKEIGRAVSLTSDILYLRDPTPETPIDDGSSDDETTDANGWLCTPRPNHPGLWNTRAMVLHLAAGREEEQTGPVHALEFHRTVSGQYKREIVAPQVPVSALCSLTNFAKHSEIVRSAELYFSQHHQDVRSTKTMFADFPTPKTHDETKDVPYDDESRTTGPRDTPETEHSLHTEPWSNPLVRQNNMILEKKTGKAITLTKDGLHLRSPAYGANDSNSWLCVLKDNHTGFWNTHSGVYLGHDGKENPPSFVHAVVAKMLECECFIARQHPEGGYQLLSAVGNKMLYIVVGAAEGRIVRARHGDLLWVFEEV